MADEDETLVEITMEGAEKDVKEFLEFLQKRISNTNNCGSSFVRDSRQNPLVEPWKRLEKGSQENSVMHFTTEEST
jgi:acylphosphatase